MRNTRLHSGRMVAAAGLCLSLLAGPLIQTASAQNVGGQIIKVLGGGNSRQGEKNAMRNLGVGLGVAAAYEALNHRGTSALILGGGAALAGLKYEGVRKTQSRENNRYQFDREGRRDHDRDSWRRDHYQEGGNDRNDRHDVRGDSDHDRDKRHDRDRWRDHEGRHDNDGRRDHDHDRRDRDGRF